MPVTLISFNLWNPDAGDVGPDLAVADAVLPVRKSFRLCQNRQVIATLTGDGPVTGALVHVFQQARVVQYARPDADSSPGSFEPQPTPGQPLYQQINETSFNDSSYILIPNAPSTQSCTLALNGVGSPGTTSGHVYQFRYAIPATTGTWTIVFALLNGPGGSVVATRTVTGPVAQPGFLLSAFTLTTGEAAAIVSYGNLALKWTVTVPGAQQLLYPVADIGIGGWRSYPGAGSTNLYAVLATFPVVTSPALVSKALAVGASDTYTGAIAATATDPITRNDHVLNTELAATNSGVTMTVSILQGATVVAQQVVTNAPTSPTAYSLAVPQATALGLTDYTQLSCSIVATYPADVASTVSQSAGVPTALISNGAGFPGLWTAVGGTLPDVLADVSDATYANGFNTGAGPLIVAVPSPGAPALSPTGYVFAWRASGVGGTNLTITLTDYLGNTITAQTVTPGSAVTAYTHTLTPSESAQVDALIPAGQPLHVQMVSSGGTGSVSVMRVEFDAAAPRAGVISSLQFDVPSASAAQISWADLEVPDPNTSYKGDVPTIYAGTKTKLYTVDGSGFHNVSASGGYATGNAYPSGWQFLQVGGDIYATNYVDPIQARLAGSGLFAPLIADPSPAPQARHMAMVRQYLLLADINLTGYGPDWIWWSAVGNTSSFTPSLTTQSGNGRVNSTPGQIMGLVGGDNGVIFKRNAVHSLTWTGDQSVFRVDEITRSVGTPFPRSVVLADDTVYFWGGNGFWRLNPFSSSDPVERVGDDVLSAYMSDPFTSIGAVQPYDPPDMASEDQVMVGWYDRAAHLIFWEYQTGVPNIPFGHGAAVQTTYAHTKRVVYNPSEDRWASLTTPTTTCYEIGSLNISNSDTHFLRGTIGFDWGVAAPNATTWYKYSGPSTLSAQLVTQRRSIGLDKADMPIGPRQRGFTYVPDPKQDFEIRARIRSILPVWSSTSAQVAPQVSITVECSNDPMVRAGSGSYRKVTTPWLKAGESYNFPVELEGYWWIFTVNIAPVTLPQMIYAFHGLYVSWDPKGRS